MPVITDVNISSIFRCTRGQHSRGQQFLDRLFSPPGAHFSAHFFLVGFPFARLPWPNPAGVGLGSARVVSWGRVQSSKRRPYPLDSTTCISLHCTRINHSRTCFLHFSAKANKYRSRKQNMFFNTLARFFSRVTKKCCHLESLTTPANRAALRLGLGLGM